MLTLLKINQFAIVDSLELELPKGFTVITGETGAGKSILMDALSLCLGDRADAAVVRNGADRADISACFDISQQPEAQAWLKARELDQGDECWLRRTIAHDGRSRGFINGTPATVADLKSLGELLIDVHSQHAHQTLLRRDTHRAILDNYGKLTASAQSVAKLYHHWQSRQQLLEKAQADSQAQADRLELVTHQLDELEKLNYQAGEYARINEEYDALANLGSLLQAGDTSLNRLTENDDDNAARFLQQALKQLEPHRRRSSHLNESCELIESALIQVQEASSGIRHYLDSLDSDPARMSDLEDRIGAITLLMRKYRIDSEELPQKQSALEQEKIELTQASDIDGLMLEVQKLEQDYRKAATALREARQKSAKAFTNDITQHLHDLGMSNARVEMNFSALARPAMFGLDDIELLFSANPGQPPKALNKVASGGELSRISLAIHVVTAQHSPVPVMVFDEVDVGIGGGIAEVVGRLLRELGRNAQVFSITHQPQVAALGHNHLRVEKSVTNGATSSTVVPLNHSNRIQEIARMSGGLQISAETLKHAEAMLANH